MMSETYKLLDSALESARGVYEHDTEVTVKQLETIRQVNTATTLNYIKKEEALKRVTRKADSIEAKKEELRQLEQQLSSVESRLSSIEQLVDELEDHTKDW
ncbi:uncharacterized protein CYBJADRAFT_73075 [Cyberlindnera jadinii NRRL Y-1542]|uniref:ENTH domain-containing protein n=1 Tax=Cyberlindnera jadinii (strain ATCC 18201 / CBS 1600 / BCRC 20928 / JCM 3617 / NBRC 0987 / NRRL Y-1542) TaxID=983966 RepID=A0A1E4S4L9_CYBJN|nr:hypothetical protein CYBJADRAFT_73075 [Cyberlindnera jadinii NRRL Y-1542]ODV74393.1 hypothetical protein CYBJADRAFT_73075 [Cyberlindnera jadinii NRRL Y-1542]